MILETGTSRVPGTSRMILKIPETSSGNNDQGEQTRGLFGAIGGNRDKEEKEEENTVAQHTRFRVTLVWQPQKGSVPGDALSATTP